MTRPRNPAVDQMLTQEAQALAAHRDYYRARAAGYPRGHRERRRALAGQRWAEDLIVRLAGSVELLCRLEQPAGDEGLCGLEQQA